jgi:hypothetical protein
VIWVFLTMLVIIGLALLVAAYVAFPRRGADVPAVPWVGSALERGVGALPTLRDERSHQLH